MENNILGLHHITAVAGNAQRNHDFYTRTLGLRLVKKTVNFDDPGTYHLYYGDEAGSPGTILTFFPWEGVQKGRAGTGMATAIGYAVPKGSLEFWSKRFGDLNVKNHPPDEIFGEERLSFEDPDGLYLDLFVSPAEDVRKPWTTGDIGEEVAIKGFHNVTLTVRRLHPTAKILTEIFGYRLLAQDGNRYRFITDAVPTANLVDIIEEPDGKAGYNAAGTNHHVAFRAKDDNLLMAFREKVQQAGFPITEKIDRNYFYSLYFREPNGVLFEIASDNPGFITDESLAELGTHLMLPSQYEGYRSKIEGVLPELH